MSAACRVADGQLRSGRFRNPGYIDQLIDECLRRDIGLVIPTIDTKLQLLSLARERFLEHEIEVMVSDSGLVDQCRDKRRTPAIFASIGIETPRSVDPDDDQVSLPIFIKPIDGSSSRDIHLIDDPAKLSPWLRDTSHYLHCAYVDPSRFDEYTIDFYFDRHSWLQCMVPRQRLEVRGSEVSKGVTRIFDDWEIGLTFIRYDADLFFRT